jgi:NAD(P)-dependent dehydrogenase (short-subunit alcohol dehydrogenase family)
VVITRNISPGQTEKLRLSGITRTIIHCERISSANFLPKIIDRSDVPLKRPAQPEEIAPAYVFFASTSDSNYITGEVLTLLGGKTMAG